MVWVATQTDLVDNLCVCSFAAIGDRDRLIAVRAVVPLLVGDEVRGSQGRGKLSDEQENLTRRSARSGSQPQTKRESNADTVTHPIAITVHTTTRNSAERKLVNIDY